jgi:hypothetical protein
VEIGGAGVAPRPAIITAMATARAVVIYGKEG